MRWASAMRGSSAISLCARMKKRGVAALVTDGVVRDLAGRAGNGPAGLVHRCGSAAVRGRPHLRLTGRNQSVAAVLRYFPNDLILVDADGAVVVPAALVDDVVAAGPQQEKPGRLDHGRS